MSARTNQDVVSIRIELDPQYDLDLQKLARMESRSKRQMGAVLIRRIARAWKENPDVLLQQRIVQPSA